MSASTKVRITETRKRGVFGWICAAIFWLWQIFMAISLFQGLASVGGQMNTAMSSAERTGAEIGTTLGVTFLLMVWALGTVVFGALMFFTRGKKVIVHETI